MQNSYDAYKEIHRDLKGLFPRLEEVITIDSEPLDNLEDKLKDFRPKLMLYGCYNAGKSTLVNAIIGKEEAKMGDTPETDEIKAYPYGEYEIFDTPGLNAPIKHEEITRKHYERCELILFVMSNEDVDANQNYDEILKIFNDKKPIIVVLNKKQECSQEEQNRLKQKIYENLTKRGLGEKDLDKISVHSVNAQSALRGVLENKNALLEHSGFLLLQDQIQKMLETDSEKNIINVCNHNIARLVNQAMQELDRRLSDPEIKLLEEMLTKTQSEKRSKISELQGNAKAELCNFRIEFIKACENGRDPKALLEEMAKQLWESLESEIKEIAKTLEKEYQEKMLECNKIYEQNKVERKEENDDSNDWMTISGILLSASQMIGKFWKHPIAQTITKCIPIILPLIIQALEDVEKENRKIEARAMQIADEAIRLESALKRELDSRIHTILEEIYDPIIKKLQEGCERNQESNSVIQDLKHKLSVIYAKIPALN